MDDLELRGDLLPQQLKLILGGLRTLKRLTPTAYARVGRVAGLEAAFVAGALKRAAGIARMHDDRPVLQMVSALIEPPPRAPRGAPGNG